MSTLLYLSSSINGDKAQSTLLANSFITRWKEKNPEGKVVVRDLAANSPHLTAERWQALFSPEDSRTPEQQAIVDYSDGLIAEIRSASTIVIGVPFYNFGMPSSLKAYFDHIARAGVTFRYGANGAEGLLPDVPVYVFAARGGIYGDAPADWQLNTFLGFVGFKRVETILAEGLAMGGDQASQALAAAQEKIELALAG